MGKFGPAHQRIWLLNEIRPYRALVRTGIPNHNGILIIRIRIDHVRSLRPCHLAHDAAVVAGAPYRQLTVGRVAPLVDELVDGGCIVGSVRDVDYRRGEGGGELSGGRGGGCIEEVAGVLSEGEDGGYGAGDGRGG